MTLPNLRQLYANHKDKTTDKWELYLDSYDEILLPYREKKIKILEIGIQNGGSLEIWSRYFKNAELILGCDIDEGCGRLRYEDVRIKVIVGDANTAFTQEQILQTSQSFDLIFDDGSHRSGDIIASFIAYFPFLNEGGLFIIEDLHCSYWERFQGGIFAPHSSINFLKRLADVINFEHWGVIGVRSDVLRSLGEVIDRPVSERELASIFSVEFRNSMCFVRKRSAADARLGTRVIAGTDALVCPLVLDLNGGSLADSVGIDERGNKWSDLASPPEVELERLREETRLMASELELLRTAIHAQNEEAQRLSAESRAAAEKISTLSSDLDAKRAALKSAQRVLGAAQRQGSALGQQLLEAQSQTAQHAASAAHSQAVVEALQASTSWRITAPLRGLSSSIQRQRERTGVLWRSMKPAGYRDRERLKAAITKRLGQTAAIERSAEDVVYLDWIEKFDVQSHDDRLAISRHIEKAPLPIVHIIWFLYSSDDAEIFDAITSLTNQIGKNWKADLIIDRRKSVSRKIKNAVESDRRMTLAHSIPRAVAEALPGQPCLLIGGAGRLAEFATYIFGVEAKTSSEDLFCDQDLWVDFERRSPRFAPNYSPEFPAIGSLALLQGTRELAHFLLDLADPPENFAKLILEAKSPESKFRHLPFVLFHAKSHPKIVIARDKEYLANVDEFPTVAIIIPTRDRLDFLGPCVRSILEKTDYPRHLYEIIVVDNGSTEEELLEFLEEKSCSGDVKVLRDASPFNYSRLNNRAVDQTQADIVLFVNNDTEVLDPLWVRRLVFYAINPEIGAVGGKLLYPDLTVQHGGVVLGIHGVAAHAHHNLSAEDPGYMGLNCTTHAVSAVTGACLAVRRSAFQEIGGFDENLAVAFNDVLLCMALISRGYRNIFVANALMIHFESKTRGYDDTEEKKKLFRREAKYARRRYQKLFKADPFYNANLSLETVYGLGFPPRVEKPWHRFRRESTRQLRILMLSSTHQVGHGVAVVVDLQARYLAEAGHQVFVAGPKAGNEFEYPRCVRVSIEGPRDAAIFAIQNGIDVAVMHTPPFYSAARWLPESVKTLAYDYGEPNPDFFPDAEARRGQLEEKSFCLEMADARYAISDAVKAEAPHADMGVIPLANSHLARWSETMRVRRLAKRSEHGFGEDIVIFNVCRFHEGERKYKGVDVYCRIREKLEASHPNRNFLFVLAGKGTASDVTEMEACGLTVFANVSDEQLIDLYCCADIYANFSRWEGYNLGIGQALAMGLPVIASDIPAHRAFGVATTNDADEAVRQIILMAGDLNRERVAKIEEWAPSLQLFATVVESLAFGKAEAQSGV